MNLVVLVENTEQCIRVLKYCRDELQIKWCNGDSINPEVDIEELFLDSEDDSGICIGIDSAVSWASKRFFEQHSKEIIPYHQLCLEEVILEPTSNPEQKSKQRDRRSLLL